MAHFQVLVCGSHDYDDAEKVRWALNRLAFQRGPLVMVDTGEAVGPVAGARWFAGQRGWTVVPAWRLTAFDTARIDHVLCFGEDREGMVSQARNLGIPVGEVL
ncbi:hypothetical protein [uncultured Hyphomicrobium sp.]|uniref:hypothetical protein n=1 Tax=uncultured Hyphomicrobium sp. TaxID=194373 RepID=UPI0025ED956F|nr:hypothetical protein [uncultured Hyphomicrobium sp.]